MTAKASPEVLTTWTGTSNVVASAKLQQFSGGVVAVQPAPPTQVGATNATWAETTSMTGRIETPRGVGDTKPSTSAFAGVLPGNLISRADRGATKNAQDVEVEDAQSG